MNIETLPKWDNYYINNDENSEFKSDKIEELL